MKKVREVHLLQKAMLGILSLLLMLTIGLTDPFSVVSFAQSQGKVTASSANIRKSADPASEKLAGVKKDDKLTIQGKTTGTDGEEWYQVFVDAQSLGFIRSNLVSITDGSTPTTLAATTTSTVPANTTASSTTTPTVQTVSTAPKAVVTEVNPTSATVLKKVRVRSDASTNSNIITEVEKGLALTVTGWADGSDGYKWWRVNFTMNGTEVTGFIRSDYVEDITPAAVGSEEPPSAPEPEEPKEPEESTAWELQQEGDVWWLVDCFGQYSDDHLTPNRYKITNMFDTVETNRKAYDDAIKTTKNLKVVIVVLVLIIIALAAVITMLIFKLRDMDDSAYFAEAERETARRRSADRPQGSGQRPMQGGQRPAQGQRPVQGQGQRPMQGGQRSVQGQGQRPMQGGQRPVQGQGQRPMQGGQRPVQGQGQRPMQGGQRPAQGQGQRPMQGQGQRPRPMQNTSEAPGPRGPVRTQERSKNFMNDEDEFEFLNWDGDEK